MRGALLAAQGVDFQLRIIPAYAGSTIDKPPYVWHDEDHPRVCGEHLLSLPQLVPAAGSSPRIRGAQDIKNLLADDGRIIPAYAGSTRACCFEEIRN